MNDSASFDFCMPSGYTFPGPPESDDTKKTDATKEVDKGNNAAVVDADAEIVRLRAELETQHETTARFYQRGLTAANLERAKIALQGQVKDYRKMVSDLEGQIKELENTNNTLERDLSILVDDIDRAGEANEVLTEELEDANAKITTAEAKLATANSTIKEKEGIIESLEKQAGEDEETIETKQALLDDLNSKLTVANSELESERAKLTAKQLEVNEKQADNEGISTQLTERAHEYDILMDERDELKAKEDSRVQTETDLQAALNTITALQDQIEKFKADVQRRPFDLGPAAYTTPNPAADESVAKTPNLADEFAVADLGSITSSVAGSDDGHLEELGTEDETMKVEKVAPEPHAPVKAEIQTVVKKAKQNIYVPFEVSAHNPIVCWFQTELNYIILFSLWLHHFGNVASRYIRRSAGLSYHSIAPLAADDFDVSLPNTAQGGPTMDSTPAQNDITVTELQHVEAEKERRLAEAVQSLPDFEETSDNREVIGDPIPPNSSTPIRHMHALAQTHGQTAEANSVTGTFPVIIDPRIRPWYTKIIAPRESDVRSTYNTLAGMVFHLVVYYCIILGYLCWHERTIWTAANDDTRAFVQQLIRNPHSNQSLLQWACGSLPEHWRHSMDVFVFKYFIEKLHLHANYAMPG